MGSRLVPTSVTLNEPERRNDRRRASNVMWQLSSVAALHQDAPGQMTWLEDPPPWLSPAFCFASVTGFICFNLTVKQSAALAPCVLTATT